MSGSITTWPSYEVSKAPVDLTPALNKLAVPRARVDPAQVSDTEFVAADIQAIAAAVPPPTRHAYTVPSDVTINARTFTLVKSAFSFTGAVVGDTFVCSQPQAFCKIYAWWSSDDHVDIYARNFNSLNTTLNTGAIVQVVKI
jgi:hypothetical protein